jgi:hypothetical protein
MKAGRAIEAAARWSGGDEDKAKSIVLQQMELDPRLREQFQAEAADAYIEKLIEGFLEEGYSLDRPEELSAAVVERLKNGPRAL